MAKKIKYEFIVRFDTGTGLCLNKKIMSTTPRGVSEIILRKYPDACDIDVGFNWKEAKHENP